MQETLSLQLSNIAELQLIMSPEMRRINVLIKKNKTEQFLPLCELYEQMNLLSVNVKSEVCY